MISWPWTTCAVSHPDNGEVFMREAVFRVRVKGAHDGLQVDSTRLSDVGDVESSKARYVEESV